MGRTKAEVKGRAARKAAKTSRASARAAAEVKAGELLERVRDAEPVARVQAAGADVAERVREANLDERAAELAERARTRVREAHLDERAAELAERVRESEAAQRASAAARRAGDQAFERAEEWITSSGVAERFGLERKRRRWPRTLLVLVLGGGLGYLAALLQKRRAESLGDPLADSADWLAATPPSDSTRARPRAANGEMPVVAGPEAFEQPLEEDVRVSLHADPRTADLPDLAIDVADGTVFIRGSVPSDFDSDKIRAVVIEVPGVTDVDLQLTPA